MAGLTLEQAQAHLTGALAALVEAEEAQSISYSSGSSSRSVTKADLGQLRQSVEFWDRKVQELDAKATAGTGNSLNSYATFGTPT
jgi:hypothetical protein